MVDSAQANWHIVFKMYGNKYSSAHMESWEQTVSLDVVPLEGICKVYQTWILEPTQGIVNGVEGCANIKRSRDHEQHNPRLLTIF